VAVTRGTISVYLKDEKYLATLDLGICKPKPGFVFQISGDLDLSEPANLLRQARDEARRRGIRYIKNLD
jgi:hypothetical protein